MSRVHQLKASATTVHWGYLDAAIPDVLTVQSGDSIQIDTVSGGAARLPSPAAKRTVLEDHRRVLEQLQPELGPHIITGPVRVEGARIGDVLRVRIDTIELSQDWGWNEVAPGCGILPHLECESQTITLPIDVVTGLITLPWIGQVSATPFFGILAVKPSASLGRLSSIVPGPFGGNMDVRHLRPGADVYFPIFADGAGFSAGDGHALQGDGEINGSAVETSLRGQFTLNVERNGYAAAFPYAVLDQAILTLGFDEDLDEALNVAVRTAIELLVERCGMSRQDAYRHCSVLGHAAVSQAVNVRKGIHFIVPTALPSSQR